MKKNLYSGKFTPQLFQKSWFISLNGKLVLSRKKGGGFIVFEGLDGSGQSTQSKLLAEFLKKKKFKVLLTKEPTLDSLAGKKIRKILDKKTGVEPLQLQELFAEDRKEHLERAIIPALKKGKAVVSDRYFFSSFTYGTASGLSLNWLIKINNKFLMPDLTFILKVGPEICLARMQKRGYKRTLFEKKEKLKKVWQIYKILPKKFKNVKIINGERSIKEVFENIKKSLEFSKNMNIAKIIDHTNIQSGTEAKDIKKTCQEAKKYGFRSVCINPQWVKLVKRELKGTEVKVVCLIDPPIGDSSHKKRVKICQKVKKDGADEIDIVINVPDVKQERWNKILKDLKGICQILPTKVIIGSGYLTDKEIKKASEIVKKAGAFCVKTATEKDPLEYRELKEKFYHLKLMRENAPGLLIKIAGKIRTLKDVKEAIKAGADIIGTSSGVEIMKGIKKI